MFKQKLKNFKISIRRGQTDRTLTELRQEHQEINQIDAIVYQMQEICPKVQNFQAYLHLVCEINEILVKFSKKSNKGVLLSLKKYKIEQNQPSWNPLMSQSKKYLSLSTKNFKQTLNQLFQSSIQFSKCKYTHQQISVSQNLLDQLLLMTALLLKETSLLALYFPFQALAPYLFYHNDPIEEEEIFECSFELFEKLIRYLKKNLKDMKSDQQDKQILFLCVMNAVAAVIDFFVTNSSLEIGKAEDSRDQQRIKQLEMILESNNVQLHLLQVMMTGQMGKSSQQSEIESSQTQQDWNLLQIAINSAITQLATNYLNFLLYCQIQEIKSSLQNAICLFRQFTLRTLTKLKLQHVRKCSKESAQLSTSPEWAYFFKFYRKQLFQLSQLYSNPLLSLKGESAVELCFEIIELVNQQSSIENLNLSQLDPSEAFFDRVSEFYFFILVAEQDQKWMHPLEMLSCLDCLVNEFNVTVEKLILFAQQNDFNYTRKDIINFFTNVSQTISTILGDFFSERHLFMESLVSLFIFWFSCNDESLNDFENYSQFWIKVVEELMAVINLLEKDLKDSAQFCRQIKQNSLENGNEKIQGNLGQNYLNPANQKVSDSIGLMKCVIEDAADEINRHRFLN